MQGSFLIYKGSINDRKAKIQSLVTEVLIKSNTNKNQDNEFISKDIDVFDENKVSLCCDIKVIKNDEEKDSIGIDKIRQINSFLKERPRNLQNKIIIISQSERLTIQAQNALLKILEEPPEYGIIILGSKTEKSLLDTVISRCKKIPVNQSTIDTNNKTSLSNKFKDIPNLVDLLSLDEGKRLNIAYNLATMEKEDIIEILEYWIYERKHLKSFDGVNNSKNMLNYIKSSELILKVKDDIENTNVNIKLALEYLLLNMF